MQYSTLSAFDSSLFVFPFCFIWQDLKSFRGTSLELPNGIEMNSHV
jgi:hypothetical protein